MTMRPPTTLPGVRPSSVPMTAEDYQTQVLEHLNHIHESMHRLAPHEEQFLWITFPQDGGFEPLPAGRTTFDLLTGSVVAPDNSTRRLSNEVLQMRARSILLFTDALTSVQLQPGVGVFQTNPGIRVIGVSRRIERIEINCDVPYLITIVLGNTFEPPDLFAMVQGQVRVSDTVIIKGAAAATADSFGSLLWVPQWGAKTLARATYGKATLHSGLLGQKQWVVRNLSLTNAAELRVQGGIVAAVVNALEDAGAAGYVNDPDIHVPGTGTASFITLGALGSVVMESSLQWGVMRLQTRLAAAVAAGQTARLVAEHVGLSFGVR